MTVSQAEQFWSEFQAFRAKWKFEVCPTTDETADAFFDDGSRIELSDPHLRTGYLKNTDKPLSL